MVETLGARLAGLRHERGLRLIDAAAASGISFSWINDLEHNRARPTLDTLVRLATAYDTTVVAILSGIEPYGPPITP